MRIREPRAHSRYLADPDTPPEYSSIRLAAQVAPSSEEIVWFVDDRAVARVGFPHEARLPLTRGRHVIRAAMVGRPVQSDAISIVVED